MPRINTTHMISPTLKGWMLAAGIYNLIYGAWVVLFPGHWWSLLSMEPPRYIELWQCIGMIVGCYGIGYLAASFDPIRHWPVVLVGFLGKVAGPLGFVGALVQETLPLQFAWMILFNDLIWWIPFFLILKSSYTHYLGNAHLSGLDALHVLNTATERGATLNEISEKHPILLVSLRHSGCIFCREALQDLSDQSADLEKKGVRLVVHHMSDPDSFSSLLQTYQLEHAEQISDPDQLLYQALNYGRGGWAQLLGPKIWQRGWEAFTQGHRVSWLDGDGFQLPGIALIEKGQLLKTLPLEDASALPDYLQFIQDEADAK
ncbi:MAG: AhpC/TSA family protein [Verrucomicrobiota bacterium]